MSDLLVASGAVTGNDAKTECFLYAKLLVKNKATPRVAVTALQLKSIMPTDSRAEETWAVMTKADVSHILNVAVGYPGGTGLTGSSPADDHYIEGRKITCRPLNPTMDYVEVDLNLTPFAWSADTHNVFPNPFS